MIRNFSSYDRIGVTVNTVILTADNRVQENKRKIADKGLQVLLVNIGDRWSIPVEPVKERIRLTDTVCSELEKRIGLSEVYNEQLATYGDIIQEQSNRVISIAYLALVAKSQTKIENNKADWFWVERDKNGVYFRNSNDINLIVRELEFNSQRMVEDSLIRLKDEIMRTNIGFNLLDKYFTVSELQCVFETILGTSICGFRKLIMPRIEETAYMSDGKAHRPARLYKMKEK